jgi:hypothetical protein
MHNDVSFPLIGQGHGISPAHPLAGERDNVVVRQLAGDPMWVRQRLLWRTHSPLAEYAPKLRDALTEAYWAEARKSREYSAWLDRRDRREP